MAFTLGGWVKNHVAPFTTGVQAAPGTVPPTISPYFELADQSTTTSPVMQVPYGVTWGYAVVRQKGWGSGSGTVGPVYEFQVAFNSAFTSQLRVIAAWQTQRDGTDQTFLLDGVDPVEQTNTFGRIAVTLSGTDAVTYDAAVWFLM